jgi:hypothetical protein
VFIKVQETLYPMGKTLDMATEPFGKTYNLLKRDFKTIGKEFLKVYGLIFLIQMLGIALIVVVALILAGGAMLSPSLVNDILGNGPLLVALLGAGFLGFFVFMVLTMAISTVTYNIVHERLKNSSVGIVGKATELLAPVTGYALITSLFMIVLVAIVGGVAILAQSSVLAGLIVVFMAFLMFMGMIVFGFLLQFTLIEVALRKRGVIDAIRHSVRLVMRNLVPTFAFNIFLMLVIFAVGAVFAAMQQMLNFLFIMSILNIFFVLIPLVILMVVSLIQSVVIAMVMIPAQYFYWKSIGGLDAE